MSQRKPWKEEWEFAREIGNGELQREGADCAEAGVAQGTGSREVGELGVHEM